jgi:hypothetical protein
LRLLHVRARCNSPPKQQEGPVHSQLPRASRCPQARGHRASIAHANCWPTHLAALPRVACVASNATVCKRCPNWGGCRYLHHPHAHTAASPAGPPLPMPCYAAHCREPPPRRRPQHHRHTLALASPPYPSAPQPCARFKPPKSRKQSGSATCRTWRDGAALLLLAPPVLQWPKIV